MRIVLAAPLILTTGCATLPMGTIFTNTHQPKDGKVGLFWFRQTKALSWDFEGSVEDVVAAAESKIRQLDDKNAIAGVLLSRFDYETSGKIRGLLFVITKKTLQNTQTLIMPKNLVAAITHIGSPDTLPEKVEILREWIEEHNYRITGPGRIFLLRSGKQPLFELQYPVTSVASNN